MVLSIKGETTSQNVALPIARRKVPGVAEIRGPGSISTVRQGFRMLRHGSVNQIGLARCDNEKLMQNAMKRTLGLVLPIFFLTTTLHAADVRVTDSGGIEVLVKDITIDYSGLLGSDKETEGVRVSQGEALVTAKWSDIQSITITGRDAAAAR